MIADGVDHDCLSGDAVFAMDAMGDQDCVIQPGGELVCFGSNANTPSGSFIDLSVGLGHGCAINDAMQVQCWGDGFRWTNHCACW